VIYTSDGNISDKTVTAADTVIIYNGSGGNTTVQLDADTTADIIRLGHSVGDGTLSITTANTLTANTVEVGHPSTTSSFTGYVNQSAGAVNATSVKIGTASMAGVYNLSGGSLTAANGTVVVGGTGASGTLNLTGGSMTITRPSPNNTMSLDINSTGLVDISGGIHNIGGRLHNSGILRVTGDAATINIHQTDANFTGDLDFIFDADGVSTIYADSWVGFGFAQLNVDLSNYQGGEGVFTLVDAAYLNVNVGGGIFGAGDITVTGLDAALDWSIAQDTSTGTVVLNVIPEPATIGLLAFAGSGVLFLRRLMM
jgi:hypothetical protein